MTLTDKERAAGVIDPEAMEVPTAVQLRGKARTKVWRAVTKVPNQYTTESTFGFRFTAIEGYWMFQKATELWGPCGIGWGYDILDDYYTDGVPLTDDMPIVLSKIHTCKIALWYPECVKPIVQYGHTEFIKLEKGKPVADGEAPKKSLTDAIKKALSMLGFGAEIYMNQMEGDYKESRRLEDAIEKAEDREAEVKKQKEELNRYVIKNLGLIETAQTTSELNGLLTAGTGYLHRRSDIKGLEATCKAGKDRFGTTAAARRKELIELKGAKA